MLRFVGHVQGRRVRRQHAHSTRRQRVLQADECFRLEDLTTCKALVCACRTLIQRHSCGSAMLLSGYHLCIDSQCASWTRIINRAKSEQDIDDSANAMFPSAMRPFLRFPVRTCLSPIYGVMSRQRVVAALCTVVASSILPARNYSDGVSAGTLRCFSFYTESISPTSS